MRPFLRQAWVVSGVALNVVGHGCVVGFPAILFPQLQRAGGADTPAPTPAQQAWIASVVGVTLVLGMALGPWAAARLGRRAAHLLSTWPMLVGWLLLAGARSVPALLLARAAQGLAMGLLGPLSSVLIGEASSPALRGPFLTTVSLSLAVGVLVVHVLGSILSWQATALICLAFNFTSLLVIIYSPETPSWLATQGRYDECRRVFYWLRGRGAGHELDEEELEAMIQARKVLVQDRAEFGLARDLSSRATLSRALVTLRQEGFYKPIVVMILLYAIFQISGINVLCSYMILILEEVVGPGVNLSFWMIFLDVQRLVSNAVAAVVIRRVDRRKMLLASGALNVGSLLAIGAHGWARRRGLLAADAHALPLLLVNLYMFSLATGMVPLPFVLAGEVFPLQYRALGNGLSSMSLSLMFFLVVKTAPALFSWLGVGGTYALYAALVSVCLAGVLALLPETRGLTLLQIEQLWGAAPALPPAALHEARRPSQPVLY